jgi:hypothetical protein
VRSNRAGVTKNTNVYGRLDGLSWFKLGREILLGRTQGVEISQLMGAASCGLAALDASSPGLDGRYTNYIRLRRFRTAV